VLRPTVSRPVCLCVKHPSGSKTWFLILSDSCGFVNVGRPVWQEDGSVVRIAAGPRQSSHSRVRVSRDSWSYFTVSDSRLPQPGRPGSRIYNPQEQGGPAIPPRHWVPFSPPPTTRRTAVEVFQLASTRGNISSLTCPAYNISTCASQETPFRCCSVIVAVETCLFAQPLLSNGCGIVAYFAAVA
jgi:hypothetical protein